ncbi:MAG: ABC transporter ATP-binding protein [Devosia sp.]
MSDLSFDLAAFDYAEEAASTVQRDSRRDDISAVAWPVERLGEGLAALANRAGLSHKAEMDLIDGAVVPSGEFPRWLDWASERLDIETEAVEVSLASLGPALRTFAPAIVRVTRGGDERYLLLLGRRGKRLRVLGPQHSEALLDISALGTFLTQRFERPLRRELDRLLDVADIASARRPKLRAAMARERLQSEPVQGIWLLRLPPSRSFLRQLQDAGVHSKLAVVGLLHLLGYVLELLAWGMIGGSLLAGSIDFGWLLGWSMLLATMSALRGLGGWANARLAIDFGRLLKSRLLAGALRTDPDEMRRAGAGHILARVMESQAFEILAMGGGLTALVAIIEFALAIALLGAGAGGALQVCLLIGWSALGIVLGLVYLRRMIRWTDRRLDLTHGLIERMVGHRTILAQEPPSRRDLLDRDLSAYLGESQRLDHSVLPVIAGLPAGWLVIGTLGLLPAFVGSHLTGAGLAIGVGGVLFSSRALSSLCESLASAARAIVAWNEIQPLFAAGATRDETAPFIPRSTNRSGSELIVAHSVGFSHGTRAVLSRVQLRVDHGDRILLQGASGSGKSTLASLLAGVRPASEGSILLAGRDRLAMGAAWHEFVAAAPQFHENHILTGTLAFNLLLGRRWPATEDDLAVARDLCEELGLGTLLARMPAGLEQMIGETGWQLSHGEKSRIFLARALLQDAELTILDESFAALDPETVKLCLDCAFRRSRTLMVIAHP